MDNTLPESYWVAGYAYIHNGEVDKAQAAFQQALVLKPNNPDAMAMMATVYVLKGKREQGIVYSDKALELNQEGGYLYYLQAGRIRYLASEYEEAIVYLEKARELNPIYLDVLLYLAMNHLRLGQEETATWIYNEIANASPGFDADLWVNSQPFRNLEYNEKIRQDLRRPNQTAIQLKK